MRIRPRTAKRAQSVIDTDKAKTKKRRDPGIIPSRSNCPTNTRAYRKAMAVIDRYQVQQSPLTAPTRPLKRRHWEPDYGTVGTLRAAEFNGLRASACKGPIDGSSVAGDARTRQEARSGNIWVRILTDGPHHGEIVQIPERFFSPARSRKRKAVVGAGKKLKLRAGNTKVVRR